MIDQLLKGLVIKTQLAFSQKEKKKKKTFSTRLLHVLEQGLAYIVIVWIQITASTFWEGCVLAFLFFFSSTRVSAGDKSYCLHTVYILFMYYSSIFQPLFH